MSILSFLFRKKKFKIGIALGSGGAKGFAHLGALKAFEENGIEFDVIGGTSIGSIVGGFYADGYSATDVYHLISNLNFKEMITGIPYNMDMSGIFSVLNREIGGKSIEELKKPYLAVATDSETMQEVVFTSGRVATAMCSSSCMLPYFKKFVDENGRKLIDGAYLNSIPADRVKEKLLADYVIGIDLSAHAEEVEDGKVNPREKGYEYSDVMLTPNLKEFSPLSIHKRHDMYEAGYLSAMEKMEQIKKDYQLLRAGKLPKKTTKN